METCRKKIIKQFKRIVWVALNDLIFLWTLMLEYIILFLNNYCKHSKTVIKIRFANVKVLTKHCSYSNKKYASAMLFKWETKQISILEIIIIMRMKTNIWITEKAQMFWKHFRNKQMQTNSFNIRLSVCWLWYKYHLYYVE